jgi:hypothetical protein
MKEFNAFLIGLCALTALESVAQAPAVENAPVINRPNPATPAEDDTASPERSHALKKDRKILTKRIAVPIFWRPAVLRWTVQDAPNRNAPRATILI